MNNVLNSPAFGIALTMVAYLLAKRIQTHTRFYNLPPMIPATVIIVLVLKLIDTDYTTYSKGGDYITFLLGPATIALSLPLMYNLKVLKQNFKPLMAGIIVGGVVGVASVLILAKLFGISHPLLLSLVAKSVTAPIAMGITENLGGIPAVTAVFVIFTGMFGALIGHKLLKLCGITHDLAIGIAMGSAAHGLGASRCLKESELQTAVAGISIGLVGIVTALVAPLLVKLIV